MNDYFIKDCIFHKPHEFIYFTHPVDIATDVFKKYKNGYVIILYTPSMGIEGNILNNVKYIPYGDINTLFNTIKEYMKYIDRKISIYLYIEENGKQMTFKDCTTEMINQSLQASKVQDLVKGQSIE